MPTARTKRIASHTRKDPKTGNKRPITKRQRRDGGKEKAPAIIADSLYFLILEPKPGVEVAMKIESRISDEIMLKPSKLYNDLLEAYQRAMRLLGKEYSRLNMIDAGIADHLALASLIDQFERNVLPPGYSYNVEYYRELDKFFFVIYQVVMDDWYLCTIEVQPIMMRLKNNPKQLWLFVEFVKCITESLGLSKFWEIMSWSVDHLHTEINECDEWDEDPDEAHYDSLYFEWFDYMYGSAHDMEEMYAQAKLYSPKKMLHRIRNHKGRFFCKAKMIKFLEIIIEYPYNIHQFDYLESVKYHYEDQVGLHDQFMVTWNNSDNATSTYFQMLDDVASNSGVVSMAHYVVIDNRTKASSLDPKKMRHQSVFPMLLNKMFQYWDKN